MVCKRPKGPCSSGRFSDHVYIPQVDGSEVTSRKVMRSKSQSATAILSGTLTKNAMISVLYAAKPRDAVMKPCFEEQY